MHELLALLVGLPFLSFVSNSLIHLPIHPPPSLSWQLLVLPFCRCVLCLCVSIIPLTLSLSRSLPHSFIPSEFTPIALTSHLRFLWLSNPTFLWPSSSISVSASSTPHYDLLHPFFLSTMDPSCCLDVLYSLIKTHTVHTSLGPRMPILRADKSTSYWSVQTINSRCSLVSDLCCTPWLRVNIMTVSIGKKEIRKVKWAILYVQTSIQPTILKIYSKRTKRVVFKSRQILSEYTSQGIYKQTALPISFVFIFNTQLQGYF